MCGFIIRFLTIFEIVIADFQVKLKMKLKHVILVYCTDLAFIIVNKNCFAVYSYSYRSIIYIMCILKYI